MPDKDLQKTCFILMPFTVKDIDQPRYPDPMHWFEVYEGLIVPAVQEVGLQCERDDQDRGSRFIGENILRKIEGADLILCDLSSHNANVFLEMGWALRADKPFVLIKDDLTTYAFDLNQQYTFDYTHSLQPRILRKEIQALADVIRRTLNDTDRRYSVVGRMTISLSALEAIKGGDLQTKILLDIQQKLEAVKYPSRPIQLRTEQFPWPNLLQQGTAALFVVKEAIKNLNKSSSQDEITSVLNDTAIRLGARHSKDIQISLLDENGILLYHDWSGLIGRTVYENNIFGEIRRFPHGAVAWVDSTSNVQRSLPITHKRMNIALFSSTDEFDWKVVVETHYEIEQEDGVDRSHW